MNDENPLLRYRNIGVIAHIDAGKTTTTERILFYTGKSYRLGSVDDGTTTTDWMPQERGRGITIVSAAVTAEWKGYRINLIDTPGHIDFTAEVQRSLRVLDGAVLVLCSVAGVQCQSFTVDRQMRRYKVPRLAFVNKCDRTGADPLRVCAQLRDKLGHNAVMMQMPIGLEDKHQGLVDLVTMKALYFEGPSGDNIVQKEIPAELLPQAEDLREKLLDSVSMFSDELMEALLEGKATEAMIRAAIRKGTIDLKLTPVFLGSAYKNKGVQPLLDAVVEYLPAPPDVPNEAIVLSSAASDEKIIIPSDPTKPAVALAFKLEDGRYGQLTYLRIYQGKLNRDTFITNSRTGTEHKVARLVRMHADEMEEITDAGAGDIVAIFGLDCQSGDTFTDGSVKFAMTAIHVPEPVISLAIKPKDHKSEINLTKALHRFTKEDPTFRAGVNPESGETEVSGMGELQLDVYIERMRREYNVDVEVSPPKVAYRETVTRKSEFNYTHKKQTGGSGQYGRVAGFLEPCSEQPFEFVDAIKGGSIPRQFISAVEKGFKSMLAKGRRIGVPVVNVRVTIDDGASHAVDSSDIAFQEAARGGWRDAYDRSSPRVLEPVMRVAVEAPAEFSGPVLTTLMQRRAMIVGSQEETGMARIEAEVPLAEMFGYATTLRSATQGKADFTMEFSRYLLVPEAIEKELVEKFQEEQAKAHKK